ncbi:IS66 family insertion sequence element accessory protein TnpA [Glaciimonas sp. GG7]
MQRSDRWESRETCDGHVKAWQLNGLSQAKYSTQQGLNATTFHGWVTRYHKAAKQPVPTRLTIVPVLIKAPQAVVVAAAPTIRSAAITLSHPNGWQCSLPQELAVAWLASLLKAIA